jgi:hypothetical protein
MSRHSGQTFENTKPMSSMLAASWADDDRSKCISASRDLSACENDALAGNRLQLEGATNEHNKPASPWLMLTSCARQEYLRPQVIQVLPTRCVSGVVVQGCFTFVMAEPFWACSALSACDERIHWLLCHPNSLSYASKVEFNVMHLLSYLCC